MPNNGSTKPNNNLTAFDNILIQAEFLTICKNGVLRIRTSKTKKRTKK